MKHPQKDDEVKLADRIDFSRVDANDRGELRNLIAKILQFEEPMPKVTVDIWSTHDHYNVTIKGWAQRLNVPKLYKKFCDPSKDSDYQSIIDLDVWPTNDEGVPVMCFKVRKSGFAKQKRKV